MPKSLTVTVALVAACVLASDCSSDPPDPKPKPTGEATIADTAPYWCGIVPKQGLQAVTGRSPDSLTESSVPAPDTASTVPIRCSIERTLMLFERATGPTAHRYLKEKPPAGSEPNTRRLPTSLGTGVAPGSDKQWHVYAYFGCGRTDNLFTLSVSGVAQGRDTDADLIRLMDIAQHRYAGAAGCDLSASGPESPTSAPRVSITSAPDFGSCGVYTAGDA